MLQQVVSENRNRTKLTVPCLISAPRLISVFLCKGAALTTPTTIPKDGSVPVTSGSSLSTGISDGPRENNLSAEELRRRRQAYFDRHVFVFICAKKHMTRLMCLQLRLYSSRHWQSKIIHLLNGKSARGFYFIYQESTNLQLFMI